MAVDIDKIRQGNHDAFKELFVIMYPKLRALARRFVDEQTACNLTQDVFTDYWEKKQVIVAENIQSFLYKSVQNKCLNYLKHRIVAEEYAAGIRLAESRMAYLEENPESVDFLKDIIYNDLQEVIEASVKKLPPRTAEAFRLCYYDEMSHKEIAETMNISVRTVETHIRQAILFLRKDLRHILMLICLIEQC
ncbi:RNA polymerase sigma-70 factor [Bacteroidia bacterium]|nr:RNA polymerase sigma-70 factor [Bacteroidia bacterium]